MSREKVIKKLTVDGHSADEAEKITDELYMWADLITDHLQDQLKIRKGYLECRNKYKPENILAIFVLESPPKSGKYFYNNEGDISEPLFKAMMKLIGFEPEDKESGLQEFKRRGSIIVDAVYSPINYPENKQKWRDDKILEWYPMLVKDLKYLAGEKDIPLILVKANICRLLGDKLKKDGFNVLNNGVVIPFPSTGQQNKFVEKITEVLKKVELSI
mgnify:CR=1 FL=1